MQMSLISYAQNHEDVLLWRALQHVENGLYIDVGASDPSEDSITKLFYDRGWTGINIEPSVESYEKLCKERSHDINLCCATGDYEGSITFYDVPTRGWSTSDREIGEFYSNNNENVLVRGVEVCTLNTIIERYQTYVIHFLKIDVEGAEESVLKGLDLSKFRPWLLLIESLSPISHIPSHDQWEASVLDSGYKFVYSDGLNRFYLAEEHYEDLSHNFDHPPNVLDNFLPNSVVHWHAQAQQLQSKVQELTTHTHHIEIEAQQFESKAQQFESKAQQFESKAQQFESKAQQFESKAQQFEIDLGIVYASRSWRITKPLRSIGLLVRKLIEIRRILRSRYPTTKSKIRLIVRKLKDTRWTLRDRYQIKQRIKHLQYITPSPRLSETVNINSFAIPLPVGKRILYLFVDHTINCSTNTGVQRVTRALANSLSKRGERVHYIKWDSHGEQALLINLDERKKLAFWNGPTVTEEDLEIYLKSDCPATPIEPKLTGENHWLIVPEVTHITFQQHPVTLDLIMWARQTHLKVGFVFYDVIPLQRPEFANMADKHTTYMQQLLLADEIWPISFWASQDLIAYWQHQELADAITMSKVIPLFLSGESSFCERIITPTAGESLILSVGTVEPRKNQVALLQAFGSYCKQHPNTDWQLILVGNLHPAVADAVHSLLQTNSRIRHLGNVTDEKLDELYRSCTFTVFPSVSEGFGLPILESLWYGKPCICANFGSMAEVAEGGGCLSVDTRDLDAMTKALSQLIEDKNLLGKLATQATNRPIQSWDNYAALIVNQIDQFGNPSDSLGTIYYWIESTLIFPKNTGIQRVSRQLARGLMEMGFNLIPVKGDIHNKQLSCVSAEDLSFFAQWNGPSIDLWQDWIHPDPERNDWFFMPELPLNRSTLERKLLLDYARSLGLKCAAIFYDAIPWIMRDIYPMSYAQAHGDYMIELNDYDLILPISQSSRYDLVDFLGATLQRPQSLDSKIKAILLAGQFAESNRQYQRCSLSRDKVKILCVGTVEPRKNHETLLRAFVLAAQQAKIQLELMIVGGNHSIEPGLADRVRAFIANHPNITWKENMNDSQLRKLHLECDFTVYPSIKEGFGLPILESLWYGKPCICANFSSMAEVAEGGGCLMVDVQNVEALAKTIQDLAEDTQLYQRLVEEAISRPFKSWQDYALEVAVHLAQQTPKPKLKHEIPIESIKSRVQAMNLPNRPLLSVCISTYNRAEWLAASLKNWEALYPNSLPEVEFLVCDNTSTDHTPEVIKPYLNRSDFSYYRNNHNVGMLGNLRQTAHYAKGQYIWILGDDDLLMPDSIERVLENLNSHPRVSLIYLNYAFTRIEDARTITDFNSFFKEATPIVPAEEDRVGLIKNICARNENFFTAIYTLVFRRDHALKAYSQDTSGRPFSTMLTCIPTTHYVLNHMMNELGIWLGTPQIVVNMNVSWMKYAPLWILERIPEVYEEAERQGVSSAEIDRWRTHTLPGVINFFQEIFENDPLNNSDYFSPSRLVRRFKHLPDFQEAKPVLHDIYVDAHTKGHSAAQFPPSQVFPESSRE
jgi:FkbM family methyltransferase